MENTVFSVLKNVKININGQKTMTHLKSKEQIRSWKDSSAVKSTLCSRRKLGFDSEDTHGGSRLSSVPGPIF